MDRAGVRRHFVMAACCAGQAHATDCLPRKGARRVCSCPGCQISAGLTRHRSKGDCCSMGEGVKMLQAKAR